MRELGVSPEIMLSRYRENGQRTVFVDSAATASGILSFYAILHNWAKDDGILNELSEAIQFHIFDREFLLKPEILESIEGIDHTAFPIKCVSFVGDRTPPLSHMISEQSFGEESSRMMPFVDLVARTYKKPIPEHVNGKTVTQIAERILDSLG